MVGEAKARTIAFMRSIPEVDQVYRYVSGDLARVFKGLSKNTVREYKREIPNSEKARVMADLKNTDARHQQRRRDFAASFGTYDDGGAARAAVSALLGGKKSA